MKDVKKHDENADISSSEHEYQSIEAVTKHKSSLLHIFYCLLASFTLYFASQASHSVWAQLYKVGSDLQMSEYLLL